MAAPRKDDERDRLYAAALRLFGEKGYIATSYKDIADACGTSRSVVQHYYPRKGMLLARFLDEHFEWVRTRARELCGADADATELLCTMAVVHFGRLSEQGAGSLLVRDLLGNRSLTEHVIMRERDWVVGQYPQFHDAPLLGDCLVVALGGAYELLSIASSEGRAVSPAYVTQLSFAPFALAMGYDPEYMRETIEKCGMLQARK